jgi:DNA mismatch repair protein MSH6
MPPKRSAPSSTPGPASLKKSGSASGQKSLLGFFSKTPTPTPSTIQKLPERTSPRKPLGNKFTAPLKKTQLTPQPSSDAVEPEDEDAVVPEASTTPSAAKALPSPVSADGEQKSHGQGTPSRKAKKVINYMESDSDTDQDDVLRPASGNRGRRARPPPVKRRKLSESGDEDVYEQGEEHTEDDGRCLNGPIWNLLTSARPRQFCCGRRF